MVRRAISSTRSSTRRLSTHRTRAPSQTAPSSTSSRSATASATSNCVPRRSSSPVRRTGGSMASQDWFDKDFYKVLGVSKDISAADLEEGVPQARAAVPPRFDTGGHRQRGEVQGNQRGVLGALRQGSARGVRPDPCHGIGRCPVPGARCRRRGRVRGRLQQVRRQQPRRSYRPADFDDLFSMFGQQRGGGLRLRALLPVDRRIPGASAVRSAVPMSRRGRPSTSRQR